MCARIIRLGARVPATGVIQHKAYAVWSQLRPGPATADAFRHTPLNSHRRLIFSLKLPLPINKTSCLCCAYILVGSVGTINKKIVHKGNEKLIFKSILFKECFKRFQC